MTSHEHEDLTVVGSPAADSSPPVEESGWPVPRAVDSETPAAENGAEPAAADGEPAAKPEAGEPPVDEPAPGEASAWPEPESAAVVEAPEEEKAEEHAEGELDIPDGYAVIEGSPNGRRRSVAVVVSRFNGSLTNRMLARALEALEEAGVAQQSITIVPVPGAFELPLAAMALAKTRRYACVVALGAVVRGETPHFDYVAGEAASGLQLAGIETGIPVSFGVLTVETPEQAEARIERAADAVRSALEMADMFSRLRASLRG